MTNWRGKRIAITGGCGFFGSRLAFQLVRQGADKVFLLDIREGKQLWPDDISKDSIQFVHCDIRDKKNVNAAISQHIDCVFHTCSFGMSGREQLNFPLIEQVNVQGTQNIIDACISYNVQTLVYTSTTNVCFCGKPLENKDESLPYSPDPNDAYSRTKCLAEKKVLSMNGSFHDGKKSKLYTCSIRPAGIYGDGEERTIPRIVDMIRQGAVFFTIGSKDSLVEFIYVDNLVSAHIRAAERLLLLPYSEHQDPSKEQKDYIELSNDEFKQNRDIVGGQAYFVSDCDPINNFEFFRPLIEGLGYSYPKFAVPRNIMMFVAWNIEWVHRMVHRIYNFQPLTRTEINKVSVTHYFKPDKARNELGYEPFITTEEGMRRVVEHINKYYPPKQTLSIKLILSILIVVFCLIFLLYFFL